jgi:hypothetical protein
MHDDLGNGPFVRSWALPCSGRRHAVQELREPGRGCGLKFHRVFSVDEDKHPLTVLLGCFLHVQHLQNLSLNCPILRPVTPDASEMAAADCLRTETYWIGARIQLGTGPDLSGFATQALAINGWSLTT